MRMVFRCLSFAVSVMAGFTLSGAARSLALEPGPREEGSARLILTSQSDAAEIYAKNCTTCHGEKGKGDGPAAAALNPPPPDLTDAERMGALSDADLLEVVSIGKGTMPGFGSMLKPEELQKLVEYVRGLSAKEGGVG